jgi:anthranilate/para-aminobenzoate synthase component II
LDRKKILFIKNNYLGKKLDYLEKYFNIELIYLNSNDLIDKDYLYLNNLIDSFDIIIIGGGPQHLIGNYLDIHPEIKNQIELIKLISKTTKLLIGICLGCQIIGKTFDLEIIQMDKLCLGFNYLDTNSIDYNYIKYKKDKYLSKINYNILSKSFSYHYDCVNFKNYNNTELKCIGYSKLNVPYIITHTNANIYGFQFHPELTNDCILGILNSYPGISIKSQKTEENSDIYLHFFEIFINS